jgi:hypothetical protein
MWPVLTGSGSFWEGPGRIDPTTAFSAELNEDGFFD